MLSSILILFALAATAVAVFLFVRQRRQSGAYNQLDSTRQQLYREHEDFKARFQVVIDAVAERKRVLDGLEVERSRLLQAREAESAQIKTEITATLDEKQRVADNLEAAKREARSRVEAEAQARRAELEAERVRLEGFITQIKANQQYAEALRKATEQAERAVGEKQQKLLWQVEELKRRLEEVDTDKERAIARAQMTRSGHVYVISNVGSFGEDVYKIGMTRRLEPLDRVKELGDASVPFAFDVHAVIYSEDAPALESKLHRVFHNRRVNLINERKEFFRVGIDEIARAVRESHGDIDIVLDSEAVEYRKTLAMLQAGQLAAPNTALPHAALATA